MMGRHLLTYMVPNLAQAVASFGTVAVLTRFLSDAEYGRYALVYTAMTLVQYLTLTWIEASAARFYGDAAEKNDKPNHFATLLNAILWCGVGFGLVSMAIISLWPGDAALKIVLAAAFGGVLARSLIKIALESRRMAQDANRFAMVDTLHTLLGFGLAVVCVVFFAMGPAGAFLGLAVAAFIVLLIEGPALFLAAKGGRPDPQRAKNYLAYGAPIAGGLVLSLVLTSGDRFVINAYLDEAAVGAYSAGYQVAARILDIIFAWGAAAATPILIAAYERGGPEEAARAAPDGYAFRLGIGAPAAIGIAMLAGPICNVLIGESLRDRAAEIVPWIALASLMAGMCDYFSEAFMLAKKALQRAALMLVPAALNIALNVVLLPRIGLMGAVVATVSAYGVGMILLAVIGRRYVKLPIPLLETGKIAFACACMAAIVWIAPDVGGFFEIMLKATLGGITYLSVALLLDLANARTRLNGLLQRFRPSGAAS
jgi:O-antigen/teichoic acid export membrane protein